MTYKSRTAYTAAQKRAIIKAGKTPVQAEYNSAGNCIYCNESGRCPGWHYAGENIPAMQRTVERGETNL